MGKENHTQLASLLRQADQLVASRRYREAHAFCQRVISQDSQNAEANFLLGAIAVEHRNLFRAGQLFERAIAIDSSNAKYHAHLARCLTAMGRHADARDVVDRAARLGPVDALTLDTIGVVYSRTGLHKTAIGFFERAVRRDGHNASFLRNLGMSQQFLGRFRDAAHSYERAIALDPHAYRVYSALVQLSEQTAEHNYLPRLEALFRSAGDDVDRKLHLGHAIAKSYEDIGDYVASFDWLLRAKEAKKRTIDYCTIKARKLFLAAADTHDGTPHSGGLPSEEPIFIIGLPRTGTTLVDRILSTHSSVLSVGESSNFSSLVKCMTNTPSNFVLDLETLSNANTIDFMLLGERFLSAARPRDQHERHFVDKMPLNFFYAGLIHRALPNARIVCIRRHPMDSCLSNFRQLFATNNHYYKYNYDLGNTAHYYTMFDALVGHWRKVLPCDRFLELHYESLVADQEGETRRLLAFCGLDWEDNCLAFHRNDAAVATASSVQVRQPIYATSVGRWKRYGDILEPLRTTLTEAGVACSE